MKTKTITLSDMKGKLSRAEMKNIKAGDDGELGIGDDNYDCLHFACTTATDCQNASCGSKCDGGHCYKS